MSQWENELQKNSMFSTDTVFNITYPPTAYKVLHISSQYTKQSYSKLAALSVLYNSRHTKHHKL